MITLLHGDNTAASRAELTRRIEEAKKAEKEVRKLDGKAADALSLTQAIESSSLFGGDVLVVIDGLLTKKTQLTDVLKRSAADILLWEEKEIGKTIIGALKASAQLFKTPVVIWELLDGIRPGSGTISITRLQKALEKDAAELIFTLVVRRIRHLIMLRDGVTPEGLQDWQAGRLTSQAKLFTMDRLLIMEQKLLDMEVSIKNGTSPLSLTQHLELFFLDL